MNGHCVIGREVDLSGYGGEEDPFRLSVHH